MGIFKAYDIRGLFPSEIDEAVAARIGKAIGTIIDGGYVYVNRDGREGSRRIEKRFIEGLRSTGTSVRFLGVGPVMIPAMYSFNEKAWAVCITASHNPAEYTGIILMHNGVTCDPDEIKRVYESERFREGRGGLTYVQDVAEEYSDFVTRGVEGTNLMIGIDTMGGAAAVVVGHVCKKIGAVPVLMNEGISENFFGNEPEPSKEHSSELSRMVVDRMLDFGVQFDGDGDRLGVVDERGEFIEPIVIGIIIAKYNGFRKVLADVTVSRILEKHAEVTYSRVGHRFIEEALACGGIDFAAESSAHFYFGRYYPFSDGLLAMVTLAKALKESGRPLSKLADEVGKPHYSTYRIRIEDPERRKEAVRRAAAKAEAMGRVDHADGCKLMFDDGFVLIRESNTEPIIKVYCDGDDETALGRMLALSRELLGQDRQ